MSEPNLRVDNVTAFLPGKDFELSRRFYRDLGFTERVRIHKAVRLERDRYVRHFTVQSRRPWRSR